MAFVLVDGSAAWDRAGVSDQPIQTGPPVSVAGTISLDGSPLTGVQLTATNSGSCTVSDAAGAYTCTATEGWTGTIAPTLSGYSFTPSSRSYTNLLTDVANEDYIATASPDTVWLDDSLPTGAITGNADDPWNWVSDNPPPYSGAFSHRSASFSGLHQHYFYNATDTLAVGADSSLFTYVYIDPNDPPVTIALQWRVNSVWQRAYWGEDALPASWGTNGTASRRFMGPLPPTGQWVRLEVDASLVDLQNTSINGMAFVLVDGSAAWDQAGKR